MAEKHESVPQTELILENWERSDALLLILLSVDPGGQLVMYGMQVVIA
jgi:hypothetical protein